MPNEIYQDLLLAQAGDIAAFERIVTTYGKPIFNYILRLLGDRPTAEEATQETFIKVYKSLKHINAQKPFNSFVYAIATNTAYDILRKKKYLIYVGLDEAEILPDETEIGEDPYYQTERKFEAETIQRHLLKLKPEQRSVILLYYYKDMALKEISQITGLPAGTVKTHLYRGRQVLKKLMLNTYEN